MLLFRQYVAPKLYRNHGFFEINYKLAVGFWTVTYELDLII